MNTEEKVTELQIRYFLELLDKKEIIQFAVDLLNNEISNDDICILAGMDFDETEEVMKCFYRVLNFLRIDFFKEKTEKDFVNFGIQFLKKYLDDEIKLDDTIRLIERINRETGYSTKLAIYEYVVEDKLMIDRNELPIFNEGISSSNFSDFFRDFTDIFIKFNENYNYEEYNNLIYCKNCQELRRMKMYKTLFTKKLYNGCSKCKSTEYIDIHSYYGMKYMLENKNKK